MLSKSTLLLLLLAVTTSFGATSAGIDHPTEKWGFIDRHGRTAIEAKFDKAQEFSEGLAAVCIGPDRVIMGKGAGDAHHIDYSWGYINKSGQMCIPPKFGSAGPFSCGLA